MRAATCERRAGFAALDLGEHRGAHAAAQRELAQRQSHRLAQRPHARADGARVVVRGVGGQRHRAYAITDGRPHYGVAASARRHGVLPGRSGRRARGAEDVSARREARAAASTASVDTPCPEAIWPAADDDRDLAERILSLGDRVDAEFAEARSIPLAALMAPNTESTDPSPRVLSPRTVSPRGVRRGRPRRAARGRCRRSGRSSRAHSRRCPRAARR